MDRKTDERTREQVLVVRLNMGRINNIEFFPKRTVYKSNDVRYINTITEGDVEINDNNLAIISYNREWVYGAWRVSREATQEEAFNEIVNTLRAFGLDTTK